MGARQNLTLSLSADTIRKAKLLAADRETSVTRLAAELMEQLVQDDARYQAARRAALSYLDQGFSMGGRIAARRDEWPKR